MLRLGREPVSEFLPEETLYLRYASNHFLEGQLDPAAIRSQPGQSVNRGQFSEPEDVLFSEFGLFDGFGVIGFWVRDIPIELVKANGPAYCFFMTHTPLDQNYAHSEINSDQIPRTGQIKRPSKTVSLEFRIALCKKIKWEQILIEAVRAIGESPQN